MAFQSQSRSQSPCDVTLIQKAAYELMFQSQSRSQSPCDPPHIDVVLVLRCGFNLSREASPRATGIMITAPEVILPVSISVEKPAPVRPQSYRLQPGRWRKFQSQSRSQSPCDGEVKVTSYLSNIVSISVEKPVPVRLLCLPNGKAWFYRFNLSREASPRATLPGRYCVCAQPAFQSQSRSQSPCDHLGDI